MQDLRVESLMSREPDVIAPDTSVLEVAERMRDQRFSCVIVCTDGVPVGIVSERDILRVLAEYLAGAGPIKRNAASIMSAPVVTIKASTRLSVAVEHTATHRIRRLPVVDDDGQLVGIVTQTDLLRAYVSILRQGSEALEIEVEERTRELVATNARLVESDRKKTSFLSHMSHEIRTPLAAILGFIDEFQKGDLSTLDRDDALRIVREHGDHLYGLVSDVLDLSKIEAEQLDLANERTSTRSLAEAVHRSLRHTAAEKGIGFSLRYHDDVPEVIATDAHRVHQILLNVVSNAIKFTEEGEVVLTVRSASQSAGVDFVVKDTGIGVAREDLEVIFEPYERGNASTASSLGGTGLGLSLGRLLAERLNGSLTLKSGEGNGSEFTLHLPLGEPPDSATPLPSRAGAEKQG